jgi:hypothetical protein
LGNELYLPASGSRASSDTGQLIRTLGMKGYYWSSTGIGGYESFTLDFDNTSSKPEKLHSYKMDGPVRCIEELSATIGALDCSNPDSFRLELPLACGN